MNALLKTLSVLVTMLFFFNAQALDLKSHVVSLNAEKDLQDAVIALKDIFQTAEDHRQIDRVYNEVKKPAEKSVWRWEIDRGKLAFRLNGKIQFWISDINQEEQTFAINGKTVHIKKGKGFLSSHNEVVGVFKTKTAQGNLFIQEAHAAWFLPLLGLFAFAGVASAASANMPPSTQCLYRVTAPRNSVHYQRASNLRGGFRGGRCGGMPTNVDQRMRLVANNFKPNGKFMTDNVGARCSDADNVNQMEGLICRCVIRKMNPNCDWGWNMNYEMAVSTCRMGSEMFLGCMNTPPPSAPAPQPPVGPAPPVYDPVTPCTVDKNGAVSGNCDPVTPSFGDKPAGSTD